MTDGDAPNPFDSGSLFDRYVVVDWSARNAPATGTDSIWVADLRIGGRTELSNPPTRHLAAVQLDAMLAASERTLLAVDVSLGYPTGSSQWFGSRREPPWRAMWELLEDEIVDDDRNRSNRFDVAAALNRRGGGSGGPFWGRHVSNVLDGLEVTKPARFPVAEFRACETWLRASGRRPSSPWQLLGAGSVGSQSLTLIPILERLRRRYGAEIWPFTTDLRAPTVPPGTAVIAEIWPAAFEIDVSIHRIRDAAQVDGVARKLAAADTSGNLVAWFEPAVADADRAAVVREEGWVLGVPGNVSG